MTRKRGNPTFLTLPLSPQDCAYLVNLTAVDITRLKGSGERKLLSVAYRVRDKLLRLQGSTPEKRTPPAKKGGAR